MGKLGAIASIIIVLCLAAILTFQVMECMTLGVFN